VRIIENNHGLSLKNNPSPIRFLGIFFLLIGSAFVYGSLGGYSNYAEASGLAIKLHFSFGIIAVCVGVWLIATKTSRVEIFAATQTVNLIESNLFGEKQTSIPFCKIKQFIVSEKEDQDGDSIWKVDAELESAEILELSSVWLHDKSHCEKAVTAANKTLSDYSGSGLSKSV
jgi:hypothetical protein